jgi:HSP20 family protein
MQLARWRRSPELRHFADEMDRWLDDFFGGRRLPIPWREAALRPWVDVYETDTEVVVKMEVPGVSKEDLGITLGEEELTVKGEAHKDEEVNETGYYRRERRYGAFARTVALPAAVIADKAKATFKDGVLHVRIPKAEQPEEKKKKVDIE